MAANVIVITDPAKWEIIRDVLCELDEGGIVIGPDAAAAYEKKFGQPIVARAGLTTPDTNCPQAAVNIDLLLRGWVRASAPRCPWTPLNHATSAWLHCFPGRN